MHILLATDADWIVDEVTAALGDTDVRFTVCRDGRAVAGQVRDVVPDLAILDLQVGSMGAMAVTMALRLDESAGVLPHVKVLMLLDRTADLHLARRSAAEGWLVKPLDSLRLRRAADAIVAGGSYTEGVDADALPVEAMIPLPADDDGDRGDDGDVGADADPAAEGAASDPSEEEPATAG